MTSVANGPLDVNDPNYRSEKAALGCGRPFDDLDEIADYLSRLLGTVWWKRRFPRVAWVEVTKPAGTRAYAYTQGRTICLPRWAWHEAYVLHELAHVVAPEEGDHHGPAWRNIYLSLVQYKIGRWQADELRRWYAKFGLEL